MGTEPRTYAVVMGDIVKSEKSLAPEQLHSQFNNAIDIQNQIHANVLVSPLTITLGDEFQGLTRKISQAAPIVRELRWNLMKNDIDCRFVIGLVEMKTDINPDKAWNMFGKGLARAREKLNEKRSGTLYVFSFAENPVTEILLNALGTGLTAIERGWTEQQRDDITEIMRGRRPAELAQDRDVSVHSIYKVGRSGNLDAYMTQWNAIDKALTDLDNQNGLK